MRLPRFALALLLPAAVGCAEDLLRLPVPLAPLPPANTAGQDALTLENATLAQALGFPSAASALYRDLLNTGAVDKTRVSLSLATALMDEGQLDAAERVLDAVPGNKNASWHLRKALLADAEGRRDAAKSELAGTRFDELPSSDKGWYYFLEARTTDDGTRVSSLYQQSIGAAASDLQKARFLLAQEQSQLRRGALPPQQLDQLRKNAETFQNQKVGYTFGRDYAVALNASGKTAEAVERLQDQLRQMPPQERAEADSTRLLLGVIAGGSDGAGRHALIQLLTEGTDTAGQRLALQLLARASDNGAARSEFKATLDSLISAPVAHPILDSLYLYRSRLNLEEGLREAADLDAKTLRDKFPGSKLLGFADMIRTAAAWDDQRYRAAADFANTASAELPAGSVRSELRVLVAEAWFRAKDYRSAADAYAAAVREAPPGVPLGSLMYQRVLSEIDAGNLEGAEAALNDLEREPAFDSTHAWEAEWNLAKALELDGKTDAAYERINRLIAAGEGGKGALKQDLLARMRLLQARLSFEAGKPAETVVLVDRLVDSLKEAPADLRSDVSSYGRLFQAQAQLALKNDSAALQTMKSLRAAYPKSDAAVRSYLEEAAHYAAEDKVEQAMELYTQLSIDFPDSVYAPYALYSAAKAAETLDQLPDANQKVEDLVKKVDAFYASTKTDESTYPQLEFLGSLAFQARLEQGDILRRLNEFAPAQRVYDNLLNGQAFTSQRAFEALAADPQQLAINRMYVQLALAECHNAQSSADPTHADRARTLFEDLVDRPNAPVDVRVEAGYNLGELSVREGRRDQAQSIWWDEVVAPFLLNSQKAEELGSKGRYWMARTVLEVGTQYENENKLDQAERAWLLVIEKGLPGGSLARGYLGRYHLNPEQMLAQPGH